VKFEWDEAKNTRNIAKHGLDFADARSIFQTPMLTSVDTRFDYDEDRYIGIGFLNSIIVLVVFTEPDEDTIRVISLRKALKHERVRFEQALQDQLG
jgi:uncharacterized DUF497 family protein